MGANKITFLAGPRYTWLAWPGHATPQTTGSCKSSGRRCSAGRKGFNSYYPAVPAATSSANSLAIQAGGGLNLYLTRNFGLRLLEADYVRTALPNAATNLQNDMRPFRWPHLSHR